MSVWDDLMHRALELKLNGVTESSVEAALAVVDGNPALVRIAAADYITEKLRKQHRKCWMWPGEHYDQLTMFVNDERFQVPDRPVRFVGSEGKEDFKPRRYATSAQAGESLEHCIQAHNREVRRAERDHRTEAEVAGKLEVAGFDVDQMSWDAMRHRDTLCQRCGDGYRADDPFVIGHKIASVQGGDAIGWEHQSCNSTARANAVTEAE